MKERSISVTEAARNFADCINRVRYQGISYLLLKNGTPVARLLPPNAEPGHPESKSAAQPASEEKAVLPASLEAEQAKPKEKVLPPELPDRGETARRRTLQW
ncbi:MAG: type II toxin-antitoxin system prevent-host-death family antitoxin [Terracidiphilus sp.]|nr:type II toxin-antitoxin system prevent-host-death family antitoxin [Terracidiphilus sp.]